MANEIQHQGRRDFLLSSGLLALSAAPAIAVAANESAAHQHHANAHEALIAEAQHCIKTGNACAAHCIVQMRTGDTDLLECLVQVQELVVACEALLKFAAFDSEHLKTYAKATIEVCETCEKECRKFEELHTECKECADACLACMEECEKVIA